jgi:hypothetical protein
MADLVQQHSVRLLSLSTFCVLGLVGIGGGIHWLVIMSLCIVSTMGLLPGKSPVLYWPVGLLVTIVSSYCGYWVHWIMGSDGVTTESSQILFGVLILLFAFVAVFRVIRTKRIPIPRSLGNYFVSGMMAILPIVLLVIFTLRWGNDPARLIAGFVAGGDHNAHNEVTHNLLSWSSTQMFTSPLHVYNYPNGLHFLVANLIALTSESANSSTLVQELRMGAWFEAVQLAAYLQLAIVVFMAGKKSFSTRILFLPPLLFVFASMDSFISHLFWSGFTTSLGMTWILLVPFAVIGLRVSSDDLQISRWAIIGWCVFLGYASWIVYLPYSILFASVAVCVVVWTTSQKSKLQIQMHLRFDKKSVFVLSTGLLTFIVALSPYLLKGTESPAVSSLLSNGATTRPFFYTVALWAMIALWALHTRSHESDSQLGNSVLRESFFVSLLALTASLIFIVVLASDYGVLTQPYYTQKMLWIVLFVSIPLTLGTVFTYVEDFLSKKELRERLGLGATAFSCLLLVPLVMGRAPSAALSHGSVDWFAKGLMANVQKPGERTTAFVRHDNLGSHVSNLALRSFSGVVTPIEFGILGNPYLMCRFINRESVTLVYSSDNGAAEMFAAGCNSSTRYVIDGTVHTSSPSEYFGVPVNTEVNMKTIEFALQHAQRGFLPFSKSGNLATGYNSTIVLSRPANLQNPKLELSFRAVETGPQDPAVSISLNGKEVAMAQGNIFKNTTASFSLNEGSEGDPIEISINCAWTDDEIKKVDPFGYAAACLKLLAMKLTSE